MQVRNILLLFFFFISAYASAQTFSVYGKITDEDGKGISDASVLLKESGANTITDSSGSYIIRNVKPGHYSIKISSLGYQHPLVLINVTDRDVKRNIQLGGSRVIDFDSVVIHGENNGPSGAGHLKDVEGTAIYAGKKTEVISMKDLTANVATNNSRQIFSKVAGLNIWENDGAGIQLGIGGRGLNPNRVTNFNTRQNGYDMSADALGYPESYYSPPAEATDRIEVVRGAASLQYGTQFGGMVNFKLKNGVEDKPFSLVSRETFGSWGFLGVSNGIGGSINKLNYYVFHQFKGGKGWRPNSEFYVNTAYGALAYTPTSKFTVTLQYTFMDYLAHQPGGLTDQQFDDNPHQSIRNRNWFKVNWNLLALIGDYRINNHLKLNTRFFGLVAQRSALGILTFINRADPGGQRDLWTDKYRNWGNETRLLYTYNIKATTNTLLVGFRYYQGFTDRVQGLGNDGSKGTRSDFQFLNSGDPEYSRYKFPNYNFALFAENVFHITSKFSITPGVRFEYIQTKANGYYNIVNKDLAGNIIYSQTVNENRNNARSFVLGGLGLAYHVNNAAQIYGNISQNYRAINFNDMRVVNPNLQVDPNLKDEKGYSADLGVRGSVNQVFSYDVDFFALIYQNRIGTILVTDTATYNVYNLRTNVSQSRNLGLESFAELDMWKLIAGTQSKIKLAIFSNLSYIDARYVHSKQSAFENKRVELAPEIIFKTGLNFRRNKLSASLQFSYTSEQFTDASNARFTSNAINGIIPAYYVMDLSAEYVINKFFSVSGTLNNLTNHKYFTRRADSYPGPGIIPADGISFFLTVQFKL